MCLGLEPGAAGWQVQTNPLSYGGTPKTQMFGAIFYHLLHASLTYCSFLRSDKSNQFFPPNVKKFIFDQQLRFIPGNRLGVDKIYLFFYLELIQFSQSCIEWIIKFTIIIQTSYGRKKKAVVYDAMNFN